MNLTERSETEVAAAGEHQMLVSHSGAADVGIVVADLDAAGDFYQDVLGLEKIADRQTAWGPMVELRFAKSVVRLMQARGAPPQDRIGLDASTGIRYLTFDIDNFDDVIKRCRDRNIKFWLDVEPIRDLRIAMILDPEGNIVEFIGH